MNGIAGFDPDQFVAAVELPASPQPPQPLREVPQEWTHGLALLAERNRPNAADPARWEQVLMDATHLVTIYADDVVTAGWSTEDLFGFDPQDSEGRVGLAVALRGRRLLRIDASEACIRKPDGCDFHRPKMVAGAPLLWTFDDRQLRS